MQDEQFNFVEQDSKLRNLEELEAARAKEAWEKHVVSDGLVAVQCTCALRDLSTCTPRLGFYFTKLFNLNSGKLI